MWHKSCDLMMNFFFSFQSNQVFMPKPNCNHRPCDEDSTGCSCTSAGVKWHAKSFTCVKRLIKWPSESFASHIPPHEITWNLERIISRLCSSSVISLKCLLLALRLAVLLCWLPFSALIVPRPSVFCQTAQQTDSRWTVGQLQTVCDQQGTVGNLLAPSPHISHRSDWRQKKTLRESKYWT